MKRLFVIPVGIAMLAGVLLGLDVWKCDDDRCFLFEWQKIRAADSFERCVSLGFPIIELYPRECRAGAKSFPEGKDDLVNNGKSRDIPPSNVVAMVRRAAVDEFKVGEDRIAILETHYRDWPNSCLGYAPSAFGCADVITSGYEVIVQIGEKQIVYRTNIDATLVKAQ